MNIKSIMVIFMLAFATEVLYLVPYQLLGIFRPLSMDVVKLSNTAIGNIQSVYGIVNMMMYLPGGYLADRCQRHLLMSLALLITAGCAIYLCTLPQSVSVLMILWMIMAIAGNLLFWSSLVASVRQAGEGSHSGIAFGLEQSSRGVIATMLSNFLLMLVGHYDASFDRQGTAQHQDKFLMLLRVMIVLAGLSSLMVFVFTPSSVASMHQVPDVSQPRGPQEEAKMYFQERFVWLLALIVGTTYIGNSTTQYFAQFAHEVVGLSIAEAGRLATIAYVMRGCSGLLAGKAADKWGKTKIVIIMFFGLLASYLCLALTPLRFMSSATLAAEIACASGFVYGLTSIYFSLLDEVGLSQGATGAVVGIVSTAGFLPGDVFMGPLAGHLLDAYPGEKGFRLLMLFAAGSGLLGLLATFSFRVEVRKQHTRKVG
eukprot:gnl/MRDRNA2_/MRDRNA2_85776_c0_seq1.p1 gnl/MRDRNA2_/MRDRNA2_85776_c0~~gnl/MRDRNA2_/MRDRNA2_85776_c0_seq1.p1  ORF type:complete len:427 (-),score=54.08 gnl/MRDRNA2_/MRDRNA2_85776_c0_seq1:428-1708(-)